MDKAYSDIPGFKPWMNASPSYMRRLLIDNGYVFECSCCSITEWKGVPAPLQIDHINGDRRNCLRTNLRFLCPNCHALTDTFSGRGRRLSPEKRFTEEKVLEAYAALVADGTTPTLNSISTRIGLRIRNSFEKARMERVCEKHGLEVFNSVKPGSTGATKSKIEWPSPEDLLKLLETHPRTEVAEMLGVSDNAIKKHCRRRGIEEPKNYRVSERARENMEARREAERRAKRDVEARANRPERRRYARMKRLDSLHGTTAGYQLEVRLKIPTCDECRKANADHTRELRNSKRK